MKKRGSRIALKGGHEFYHIGYSKGENFQLPQRLVTTSLNFHDLSSAWRKTCAPLTLPDTNDEYWVHTNNNVFEVLEKLGLSKPIPKPESKKKGQTT